MKALTPTVCGKILSCLAGMALFGLTAQAQTTYPTIGIHGLVGAEHWVWIEAEYANGTTTPATFVTQQSGAPISGYMADGPVNIIEKTTGTIHPITWNVYIPAAMSSNAAIYARALLSPSPSRAVGFYIDNVLVTDPDLMMFKRGHGGIPGQWIGFNSTTNFRADIGSVSAGAHELKVTSNTWGWKWDGVLIYDGTPTLGGIVDNGSGRYWMSNPGSANSPVLIGNVTPIFDIVDVPEGGIVRYWLNGQEYTPGTIIGPGNNYELVVAIFASSDPNSQRLAFAGANFSVAAMIPEPSAYGFLVAGVVGVCVVLRRPRRVRLD